MEPGGRLGREKVGGRKCRWGREDGKGFPGNGTGGPETGKGRFWAVDGPEMETKEQLE